MGFKQGFKREREMKINFELKKRREMILYGEIRLGPLFGTV